MIHRLVFLAIVALPVAASAQPDLPDSPFTGETAATIHGVVTDRATGQPIAGVSIYLAETGEVAITGDDGGFDLLGAGAGTFEVVAVDPSYRRLSAKVVVTADGASEPVALALESLGLRGDEIVVEVDRTRTAPAQTTMPRDEITRVPGARGDALQAVKSLPGIAKTDNLGFGSGLVIRGSAPADSRIFVDGFEIPILYHFGGLQSVIPSEMIDDLVYTPGGFGVELGKASSGVIEVETRAGDREYSGFGEVSFINAAAQAQGPIGKGHDASFAVGVRRSYIDAVIPAFVSGDDLQFTTLPRYYDYQARAEWKPTDHWKLSSFLFGTDDAMELATTDTNEEDPAMGNRFKNATRFTDLIAAATYDDGTVHNRLSGRLGTQLNLFEVGTDRYLRVERQDVSARDEARLTASKRVALIAGGELAPRWVDVKIRMPRPPREGDPRQPSFTNDPLIDATQSYETTDAAGWGALELEPIDRLTLTAGVRTDYFGRNDKIVVQPRANARLVVAKDTAVLAAAGEYSRPPDNADENLQAADIAPERALQFSVGMEKKLAPGLELTATAFYTDRSDLIVFANGDRTQTPDNDGAGTYNNEGTGTTYGAEALLKVRTDRFFGWLAYTFSHSARRDHPMDAERMFDYDQMHNLVVLGSYKLGKWQLGGRFQFVTGTPYTPVMGSTFASDTNTYAPEYGAINSLRNGPEHQLDVRVDRFFKFKTWTLSVYLDVANVYMNAPTIQYNYSYDYSERQAIKGLPILPSFGIRGEL